MREIRIVPRGAVALANGEAATGASTLVKKGGAEIVGIGILIEKVFQRGIKRLEDQGYEVRSLARVSKLAKGIIQFTEADLLTQKKDLGF